MFWRADLCLRWGGLPRQLLLLLGACLGIILALQSMLLGEGLQAPLGLVC